ncbi:hypothetical protein WJX81_007153 [Elliptochloris bilobata]|uniref:Uncharacterized protein n=1 Tax=Elliptochloris bilobata TaxID=381761 RepID=A0AAW1QXJ0_9CHLO
MNELFKKKPTVKEQVRASQRDIGRNVRDLERELLSVDREEAKLVKEIKSAAAKGNVASARTLAKSLVRLRGQKAKLHAGILQMRGVRSAIATTAATSTVGQSMATATSAMQAVGAAADPQKMVETMQKFSRENAKMDMAGEVMDDTLDDTLDGADAKDETNDVVNQVLDEIGIDTSAALGAAPARKIVATMLRAPAAADRDEESEGLTARLAALK